MNNYNKVKENLIFVLCNHSQKPKEHFRILMSTYFDAFYDVYGDTPELYTAMFKKANISYYKGNKCTI